jgi:hypothetical protein
MWKTGADHLIRQVSTFNGQQNFLIILRIVVTPLAAFCGVCRHHIPANLSFVVDSPSEDLIKAGVGCRDRKV